jgi:hypothetical protein
MAHRAIRFRLRAQLGCLVLTVFLVGSRSLSAQGRVAPLAFDSVTYLAEHPIRPRPGEPTYQAPVTRFSVLRRDRLSDSLYLAVGQRLTLLDDSLLTVDLVTACGQSSSNVRTVTLTLYSATTRRVARSTQCDRSIPNPPLRLAPYLELENLVHELGERARLPRRP